MLLLPFNEHLISYTYRQRYALRLRLCGIIILLSWMLLASLPAFFVIFPTQAA